MLENYSSAEFEKEYTYLGDDLGAIWTHTQTSFRVWAPTADAISIRLYQNGTAGVSDLICNFPMLPSACGTWSAIVPGDLDGTYYTYLVKRDGKEFEACDPYAHAVGINGKRAMVINLAKTNPSGWEIDRNPNAHLSQTDAVIYEVSIRDISSARESQIPNARKYLGLAQTGTHTTSGQPTGLDYIKDLGITHVQLMPVYDFGSVDENDLENKGYNWGYDPVNYNVPEGSYSTDPFHGEVRIKEFKQMIYALHSSGLSVVMDVVYNHVYHTNEFCMNQIVPGYFSRTTGNKLSNASGCGNDTASERTMVRKFIVDSVNYWADEYHIDGFRFDLAGLLDTVTINEIMFTVHKKHPDVIFYGEGWDMPTEMTKYHVPCATQRNAALIPGFAFFNDTIRDTLRGSVFSAREPGYISGATISSDHLANCFCGRTYWASQPKQLINYVSCHDNHTLHDKIAETLPNASEEEIARRCRLAAAFTILSAGTPFFLSGEELLRSKKSQSGNYVSNSFRSPDRVNSIKWKKLNDPNVLCTHFYYKGLLAIRRNYTFFRVSQNTDVARIRKQIPQANDHIAAFLLEDNQSRILCIFNNGTQDILYSLPEGVWQVLVSGNYAGIHPTNEVIGSVLAERLSALVLVKKS